MYPKVEHLVQRAEAKGVRVRAIARATGGMGGDLLQSGARAKLKPFPYRDLEELLDEDGAGLIVVLDHVFDPRNLGAAVRAALAAGSRGVVIPKDRAAQVTPAVEVAAAGACAHLPIARVVNVRRALDSIRAMDFWVVALDQRAEANLFRSSLPSRLALVVGGEEGLSRLVHESVDQTVRIPTDPRVESLNLAVAMSIACFWWSKDYQPWS
ncbi:MAG: RNA methyltransferase [Candidatus Binatia bacterium]|nr:RNA methyltransferase [Candidatus Binatia bacterium]